MTKILGYSIDEVLALAGIGSRRTQIGDILPAIGLIAVGAAVGAGLGLIFAPAAGSHLRQDLVQGVGGQLERLRARIQRTPHKPHINGAASHPS